MKLGSGRMRDGKRGQGHKGKAGVAMWVKALEELTVGGKEVCSK